MIPKSLRHMDPELVKSIPLINRIFWGLQQEPGKGDLAVLKLFIDKFPTHAYNLLNERLDKENYALAISLSQRFMDEPEGQEGNL